MSDRKEFNDFCDKNGITNLTAGLQLFEQCYDKLRMSFAKDTDSFPSDGVGEGRRMKYPYNLDKSIKPADK